jgi:hypothetical protein
MMTGRKRKSINLLCLPGRLYEKSGFAAGVNKVPR